jgi:hypothetical protein
VDREAVDVKIEIALDELRYVLSIGDRLTTLERHMAKIDDLITQINDATNAIAAKITRIQQAIEAGDGSAAARLQPLADQLTALGQDPSNPVPPVS